MTHPLRADIPIYLGAEGPKNVAMTAEIADGWLPLYYSPFRQEVYADQLAGAKDGFEVAALCNISVTDDVEAALMPSKASLGFYIGGMGAEGANFHTNLMARMGYEGEAYEIQRLFLEGKRDEAIATVPSAFADEISLVGPPRAHPRPLASLGRQSGHDAARRRARRRHDAYAGRTRPLRFAMELKFVAGVTPIVRDLDASLAFYRDALGVPVANSEDHPEYFATDDMPGLKHIGLWRLEDAAEACFGTNEWPSDVARPASDHRVRRRRRRGGRARDGGRGLHARARRPHRTLGSGARAGDEPRRPPHRPHLHPLDARLTMRR